MCFDYYHILPTKAMFKPRYFITILTLIFFSGYSINAQRSLRNLIFNKECRYDSIDFAKYTSPSYRHAGLMIDRPDFDSIIANPERHYTSAMQLISSPVVFKGYELLDSIDLEIPERDEFSKKGFQWLDDYDYSFKACRICVRTIYMPIRPKSDIFSPNFPNRPNPTRKWSIP